MKNKKPKKSASLNRLKGGGEVKHINPISHEWYKATFDSAEIKEGSYGEYIQLKFELLTGELQDGSKAKGKSTFAFCQTDLNIGTDSHDFVSAIIGHELEEGEALDLESHYGSKIQVFIEVTKKADNTESSKVTKMRVIKKKSTKKKSSKKKSKK